MYLPTVILNCISRLESAGFSCYAVGGCVRDACLGITPQDYDLCTNATPDILCNLFSDHTLVLSGLKHGTVGVVTSEGVVEITTFRTEGGYTDSRHPDWVEFVGTIEEDLARRDFTVNAMAYSPTRGYADPFGGRSDLRNGILRAVGEPTKRFEEDALRILRGVRFAVRFHLQPEPETQKAIFALSFKLNQIAVERIFDELWKLLPLVTAQDLQTYAPIFTQIIPELSPTVGFDQHSPHHEYDIYTHTAYVTQAVAPDPILRWAALLHDVGKVPTFTQDSTGRGHFYGHAQVGAKIADEILCRLKAPKAMREQVVFLIAHHMQEFSAEKPLLRRWLSRYSEEPLRRLLSLQQADYTSKGVAGEEADYSQIFLLLEEIIKENGCLSLSDLAVNGHDLMALGLSGKDVGASLNRLLQLVLEEKLPNEKPALLQAIKEDLP